MGNLIVILSTPNTPYLLALESDPVAKMLLSLKLNPLMLKSYWLIIYSCVSYAEIFAL